MCSKQLKEIRSPHQSFLTLQRVDQLRNTVVDFVSLALINHIKGPQNGQEPIGIHLLPQPIEEGRKEVLVLELAGVDLPLYLVVASLVEDPDRQVSSVIKSPEVGWWHLSPLFGSTGRRGC